MIPLICDPVPGPGLVLTTSHRLSEDERKRLRELWDAATAGPIRPMLIKDKRIQFKPLVGERTEWPDAEYCGA
jgi:hypothetical protein